ncbi:MAG: molybdenum cofactor biosynthesis protein MoaE [Brevibacterium yomogidense]
MTRQTRPDADRRPRRATRGGDRSATFGEGRRAVVLVVSTSGYAGEAEDATGPLLVGWLGERGYRVDAPQIVPDGPAVGEALRRHVRDAPESERPRVIVTTGGTGLAPEDTTPEETRRVLDREATGIVQALVDHGLAKLPEAAMSRGTAGACDRTFVVNLPGSVGGVKDGITVLDPILHHIQAQLENARDGVHAPRGRADGGSPQVAATNRAPASEPAVDEPGVEPFAWGRVTEEPLDLTAAEARVKTPQTGALAVFHGVVRDHDSGRDDVVGLAYTAHPRAQSVLDEVLAEAVADHPGVRMSAEHRIGELRVGDDALLVAVASAHRREAFTACAELVDRIKARVPIWKRQDYSDGGHDWVGVE